MLPHLLLFITFYLWSLTNLRRVHLWETRRQRLEFASLDAQFKSHFSDLERDLDIGFGHVFFSNGSWIILVAVLVILLLLRPFTHVASFEPFLVFNWKLFDALYVVYLLIATTFLTHSLLRFLVCWAALQKMLRRLERQPIRHAFDRLPKKFYSWTPIWHAGGARRTFALQTRSLECLRKLRSRAATQDLPEGVKTRLPGLVDELQAETSALSMPKRNVTSI